MIKTNYKMYLVETKADKDLHEPSVLLKTKAAHIWCLNALKVSPPEDMYQPKDWEYLVLSEGLFKANSGLGFEAFIPYCKELRNKMIERYDSTKR